MNLATRLQTETACHTCLSFNSSGLRSPRLALLICCTHLKRILDDQSHTLSQWIRKIEILNTQITVL